VSGRVPPVVVVVVETLVVVIVMGKVMIQIWIWFLGLILDPG